MIEQQAEARQEDRQRNADLLKQALDDHLATDRANTRRQAIIALIGTVLTVIGIVLRILGG